jgi:hypothetical protein
VSRSGSPSIWPLLAVALAALLLWHWVGDAPGTRGSGTPSNAGVGSRAPCQVPLSWHVERLDPRFGLSALEAQRAVEAAASMWARALGGTALFPHEEGGELAIRFVYDERQQRGVARREQQARVDERDARIDARGESLARAVERLDREIARHNATVAEWNRRGGAPPEVAAELQDREADLGARERSLHRQIEELNREVAARNLQVETLARDFPSEVVESGRYGETVRRRFNRITSVSDREIRIFRFEDRDDLVMLLAHELGHALGLDHAPTPGAVMSAVHSEAVRDLQPVDLALLRERCPALVAGGGP